MADPREIAGLVDQRLARALNEASNSPLGMPTSVETFRAWLERARLELVARPPHNPISGGA